MTSSGRNGPTDPFTSPPEARTGQLEYGVRLFTSSVSVLSAAQRGPLGGSIVPQPGDEYGRYKLECERRVQAHHPEVLVVGLGWQIGLTPGGNPGLRFFEVFTDLEHLLGAAWQVVPGGQPVHNHLLSDERVSVRSMALRFSGGPDESALPSQPLRS